MVDILHRVDAPRPRAVVSDVEQAATGAGAPHPHDVPISDWH